ncbi:MAG: dTDP-4-dehydrorhamnose reductase [Cyanobacteria bacterium]|nr:dTDP-4-dehydrorhamnose reductase [Cyanobacteriota bacterium]MDW8199590.1 dTDP-4-dehydrorhamnose reductase [Cyanobacteriota bacterium SKYGB_h_bin112]
MTQILLTGAAGQLGHDLQPVLATVGEVMPVSRDELDLSQPEQVRTKIRDWRPRAIVNAAAYTAVDKAESEADLANTINGTTPTVMAEVAQELHIPLIHISTDYVFDGQKNTPYLEDDTPNPVGAYGKSKLLGEDGVRQACDRHLILRTAWVYGVGGKGNFVKTMLRLGKEREELRVVVDQVGTPTWTGDLATAIAQLLLGLLQETISPGTYHYTNSGAISWYDFAVAIFEEAAALDMSLAMQRVVPITTAEYPTPAKRPAYSVLSGKKVSAALGTIPPHWRSALRVMLRQMLAA